MTRFSKSMKKLQTCIIVVLLSSAFIVSSCARSGGEQIGQWDRFEATIYNPESYDNPFADVDCMVVYTRPDGSTYETFGFYDGEGVWKFRCMPDQLGVWQFQARFTDGSKDTTGVFTCVTSDIPGMISTCAQNPIWFGFTGGDPARLRSLHCGDRFFANQDNALTGESWSDSLRTVFLEWATAQGYNMLSVASHYLNREQPNRGAGWNTPDLWDEQNQQPNPAEFQRMERILSDLAERRLVIYPFAGFFGKHSDYPTDPALQDMYVKYTCARLGSYWNLLFNVAGPEPLMKKYVYWTIPELDQLGKLIQKYNTYNHLTSIHNRTGHDEFADLQWVGYTILQGLKTTDRQKLYSFMRSKAQPKRPLFAQETLWPGNTYGHPPYSDTDIRKNAYVLMMSGAAINFGDMESSSSSGFSGSLLLEDKVQRKHELIHAAWDMMDTFPWYDMKPSPELVDQGYCLAHPGEAYLVYLEQHDSVSVNVEPGLYQVEWIDAQNGDRYEKEPITDTALFKVPQKNKDWFLYLKRQ